MRIVKRKKKKDRPLDRQKKRPLSPVRKRSPPQFSRHRQRSPLRRRSRSPPHGPRRGRSPQAPRRRRSQSPASSNRGTGSRRGGPDEQEPVAEGEETSPKVGLDKSKSLPPTTLAKRRSASKGKDEAEKQRLKQETAAEKEERQFQERLSKTKST